MRIDVAELDIGQERRTAFSELVDSRTSDVTFDAPVTGEIEVARTPRTVHLQGRLATTAPLMCGRCLTVYRQSLAVAVNEQFVIGDGSAAKGALRAEDFVLPLGPDLILDVTEAVRQHLLLTLPMVPVCRPECRGLCPRCGTNLNDLECGCQRDDLDPRLAPLLHLDRTGNTETRDVKRERRSSRSNQEE